jgi:hypothetical protein
MTSIAHSPSSTPAELFPGVTSGNPHAAETRRYLLQYFTNLARIRQAEYLRERRPRVDLGHLEELRQWRILGDESLADWVNRQRPAAAPEVTGEPEWNDTDDCWTWSVGEGFWTVFVFPNEKMGLSITWAKCGSGFWYSLSPWGEREIEGSWEKPT